MKAQLQHLIKSEGLTASRFAEMLEIQPAGVSHILAGRNKPSFDLLQKILRRFPKINPDWLLLDSEQMYREGWNEVGNSTSDMSASRSFGDAGDSTMPMGSLFDRAFEGAAFPTNPNGGANVAGGANANFEGVAGGARSGQALGSQNHSIGDGNISAEQAFGTRLSRSRSGLPIEKIVIFYADGTFEAYSHGL